MTEKSQKRHLDTISRSPGNRVSSCPWRDRIREIYGFYGVTGNFELDFRLIGWLYLVAAFYFSSSFFELSPMGVSIKIGQVPYCTPWRDTTEELVYSELQGTNFFRPLQTMLVVIHVGTKPKSGVKSSRYIRLFVIRVRLKRIVR